MFAFQNPLQSTFRFHHNESPVQAGIDPQKAQLCNIMKRVKIEMVILTTYEARSGLYPYRDKALKCLRKGCEHTSTFVVLLMKVRKASSARVRIHGIVLETLLSSTRNL